MKILKDRKALIHILRNPHGWSEDTVRDARVKAAAELERLWNIENRLAGIAIELNELSKGDGND